ncbi:hypothetical protein SPHINGOT1_120201 [Sphingomonas sp. T1]|nr:hypothetical protein SPHINGOT1_120201 [Sphingomonas sp. T1]
MPPDGGRALEYDLSGELLLLGAPRTAGFHFCCPVWPEPRFRPYNLGR